MPKPFPSIPLTFQKRLVVTAAFFTALLLMCLFGTAASAQTVMDTYHRDFLQQLEDDYGLTGGDWLFYDNEEANFNAVGVYGNTEKTSHSVENQPFSLAVQLEQPDRLTLPWDTGAVLANQTPVAEGDIILISLWVRTIEATVDGGYIRSSFQDRTTYESSGFYPILPTSSWQQLFIPFQIVKENDAETAIFGLQLGAMPQTLEIAGLTGINYRDAVELADLPQSPLGNYRGQEADAAWRVEAEERIEAHRKADLTVTVLDRNGAPIPDAQIAVQMQEHAFRFGSAVTLPNLLGDSADDEIYRERLTNLDGNGHGFNTALLEWGLQWLPWEEYSGLQYRPERMVEAFSLVKEMGMTMRAHSLVWGGWRWMPPDMKFKQEDVGFLLQRIEDRVQTMLTYPELAGEIFEWDVVNEARYERDLANAVAGAPGFPTGDEINPYIFKLAQAADPEMRLAINDNSLLSDGGLQLGSHQRYHKIIQDLINADARLDVIGLQSHMAYPLTAPERIYDVLEEFAIYGKEIHISEYDVEIDDEAKAGDYTRDFLTVTFSHPSVTGFTLWNFWDPAHWKRNSALFRHDWSVKPSGEAIFDLLFNAWWTDESGTTNADGAYQTRAFFGMHEINVSYEDEVEKISTTVISGTNAVTLMLDIVLPQELTPQAVVSLSPTAPQIDGAVDAIWDNTPTTHLNKTVLGEPAANDDLSANFRLLAADGSLYVLVNVVDNELRNDSGEEWWHDDAIEIYLNGDLSDGHQYDGVNDAQLVFRWDEESVISGPNSVDVPSDIDYALVSTENGYRLEAKIPTSSLALPLLLGSSFGIEIHVIDDDSGTDGNEATRERKMAWAASTDDVWQDPSLMGIGVVTFGAYLPLFWQ